MNRREFIMRLQQALHDMPEDERRRAVEYYENYFDEAGPENEQEVLRNLGAPEKVAADILRDYDENRTDAQQVDGKQGHKGRAYAAQSMHRARDRFRTMDSGQKLLVLALVILALIVVVPASIGVIGGVGGLLIGAFCVVAAVFLIVPALDLAAWGCFIGFAVVAGIHIGSNLPVALCSLGLALIFAAVGILLWRLTVYLFCTVFPALIRSVVDGLRRLCGMHKGE
ncbi:MAG: DUF1700 domain-containing protein [Eubacteriales bacterium]|nr:DUF1700 domain-containing protein [Eubacteriales bacterium]